MASSRAFSALSIDSFIAFSLEFKALTVRTLANPNGHLLGVGALQKQNGHGYNLPSEELDRMVWSAAVQKQRGFYEANLRETDNIKSLMDNLAQRWLQEAAP